jgi:hypothetical protein
MPNVQSHATIMMPDNHSETTDATPATAKMTDEASRSLLVGPADTGRLDAGDDRRQLVLRVQRSLLG